MVATTLVGAFTPSPLQSAALHSASLPPLFNEGHGTHFLDVYLDKLVGKVHESVCRKYEEIYEEWDQQQLQSTPVQDPLTVRMLLNCD